MFEPRNTCLAAMSRTSAGGSVTAFIFSMLFALGDCLPPSRIVGRTAIETVGYKGSYASFLRATAVPWLFLSS